MTARFECHGARLSFDTGHDDYYRTGRHGCPDIANSPVWTTLTALVAENVQIHLMRLRVIVKC